MNCYVQSALILAVNKMGYNWKNTKGNMRKINQKRPKASDAGDIINSLSSVTYIRLNEFNRKRT